MPLSSAFGRLKTKCDTLVHKRVPWGSGERFPQTLPQNSAERTFKEAGRARGQGNSSTAVRSQSWTYLPGRLATKSLGLQDGGGACPGGSREPLGISE